MNATQAVQKLADVIRRKHFSLNTEQSYCGWLKRYCAFIGQLPPALPSEQKLERFLTALARDDVAASTQNQAFNAIIFFYKAGYPGWGSIQEETWFAADDFDAFRVFVKCF